MAENIGGKRSVATVAFKCSSSLKLLMLIEEHALMSSSVRSLRELKSLLRTISKRAKFAAMLYMSSAAHKLWYFS
jgi:hypothetical protein